MIKILKRPDSHVARSLGRFKPAFDCDMENELVMHMVVEMQQIYYGLRLRELLSLTYQLAGRNHINHPFSSKTKQAGKDWTRVGHGLNSSTDWIGSFCVIHFVDWIGSNGEK